MKIKSIPSKVGIAYQATRQDFLLVSAALAAHATTSLGFWVLLPAMIYLGYGFRRFSKQGKYIPPEIDPADVPRRTYFFLMDDDDYGPMSWWFRKRRKQYFTWSFFFVNIIFCPVQKTDDTFGLRRLQLHHEFAHCARGELLLVCMTAFAAFQMITNSALMATIYYDKGSLYYFHSIFVLFGSYLIWVGTRVMRRREHIADFATYSDHGDVYLQRFLKSRVVDFNISISGQKTGWLHRLWSFVPAWHPSFPERVDFIERSDKPTTRDVIGLIFAAALTTILATQITQTMLLPRGAPSTATTEVEPSSFLLVGYTMHFVLMGWLCWLIARSRAATTLAVWIPLSFVYCFGPAVAQYAFMKVEDIYFASGSYHIWHFIYPWAASTTWWLVAIFMRIVPPLRRSHDLVFSAYMLLGYLLGFIAFISLLSAYERGSLQWGGFYELMILVFTVAVACALAATILIGCIEFVWRSARWIISNT